MTQQLTLIPTVKTCTRCHETKPVNQFNKRNRAKDGVESACKECRRVAYRAWREANREQILKSKQAWYKANREWQRENARARYEANRERYRENYRAWAAANRDKRNATKSRRRARKQATVPQRWIVDHNLGDPHACWWCGRELLGTTSHIDHVMPIKLGGPAHPDNEVTTCDTCNLRKRDSHPLVWIARLLSE